MTPLTTPIVEFTNVSVELDGEVRISNISFAIPRNTFVYMHGKTGCGKSLILKLIAGFLSPTAGEVHVAGDLVNDFNDYERRQLRRSIGIVNQEGLLLPNRTILENVMLPAIVSGSSFKNARVLAQTALKRCHLTDHADDYPQALSFGQRQIACLARAIMNSPKLILADEPVAHLDIETAQQLIDLLGECSLNGISVIMASHIDVLPENIYIKSLNLTPTGVYQCN